MTKALVLLSGGCDSATCLGMAVERYGSDGVCAATVSYGQKHAKETSCAVALAEHYGVPLHRIDLSGTGIFDGSSCSLLAGASEEVPDGPYSEQLKSGGVSTYVPFRNGLLASAMASLALSIDDDSSWEIWLGAHADDSAGEAYPDCSAQFVESMSMAIGEGTYGKVSLLAPFVESTKADVVRAGLGLGVPYELTWSCYKGGERQCGRCGTCIDRKSAFAANGATDPVPYEIS